MMADVGVAVGCYAFERERISSQELQGFAESEVVDCIDAVKQGTVEIKQVGLITIPGAHRHVLYSTG